MRCYNGCPDSELQALLDETHRLRESLRAVDKEARVTYFPMEEKYRAHRWGEALSDLCDSLSEAVDQAITQLRSLQCQRNQSL